MSRSHDAAGADSGEAPRPIDLHENGPFLVGCLAQLLLLEFDLVVQQLVLRADGDVLAHSHAEAARDETGDPGQDNRVRGFGRRAATPMIRQTLATSPSVTPNTVGRRTLEPRVSWGPAGAARTCRIALSTAIDSSVRSADRDHRLAHYGRPRSNEGSYSNQLIEHRVGERVIRSLGRTVPESSMNWLKNGMFTDSAIGIILRAVTTCLSC